MTSYTGLDMEIVQPKRICWCYMNDQNTRSHIHTHTHIHVKTEACRQMQVCALPQTHTHTHTHLYIHTHIIDGQIDSSSPHQCANNCSYFRRQIRVSRISRFDIKYSHPEMDIPIYGSVRSDRSWTILCQTAAISCGVIESAPYD